MVLKPKSRREKERVEKMTILTRYCQTRLQLNEDSDILLCLGLMMVILVTFAVCVK